MYVKEVIFCVTLCLSVVFVSGLQVCSYYLRVRCDWICEMCAKWKYSLRLLLRI